MRHAVPSTDDVNEVRDAHIRGKLHNDLQSRVSRANPALANLGGNGGNEVENQVLLPQLRLEAAKTRNLAYV